MDEWQEVPFSEAVLINPPIRLKNSENYPFVDMASVEPSSKLVFAKEERKFTGGGSRFQSGDTLMARITPCLENGKIGQFYSDNPTIIAHGSTEFIVIRGRPTVSETEFAYYLTKWEHVRSYAIGQMTGTSGRQRVPVNAFDQLLVPIPSVEEQRAIVSVLSALDDKINLNRRINETLEAMARAIFKDWFVDFGPVRAKAEGRPPYLAPDLWALFPDALDDEDKPVGWTVVSLSEFAYLNPESWSKNHQPVEIKYVDLANTKWGVIETTQRFNWKEAPSRAQRILRTGDTIVGTVRPGNGSFSFIGQDGFTGSTGFAVLRPKMDRYREFVYLSATSSENIERLTHLADGAAYPAVRPDVVIETESIKSNEELLIHFSEIVEPLFAQIECNKVMSKDLAQLRDLLLPKLMSGEIRLCDAEKVVEAVA